MTKSIIFDFESTGFKPLSVISKFNRILEFSATCIETNVRFTRLVNPGMRIPWQSTAIHHVTDADVANAPPFEHVWHEFVRTFDLNDNDEIVLMAHNCHLFDEVLLRKSLPFDLPSNIKFFDTLLFFRWFLPNLKSWALPDLYKSVFQEDMHDAHRASADVNALHRLWLWFRPQVENPWAFYDLYDDQLTSFRFIKETRAKWIIMKTGYKTRSVFVYHCKRHFDNNYALFDQWVRICLDIPDPTQRLMLTAQVFDIPLHKLNKSCLFYHFNDDDECLDDVDYYVKFKYCVAGRPQCGPMLRGVSMIKTGDYHLSFPPRRLLLRPRPHPHPQTTPPATIEA